MAAQRRTGSLMPRHESALDGFGVYQLLASQTTHRALDTPEALLWLAVLEGAVEDLARYGGLDHALARQRYWAAADFIVGPQFGRICGWLGLDAEHLREGLARVGWRPGRSGGARPDARAARGLGA